MTPLLLPMSIRLEPSSETVLRRGSDAVDGIALGVVAAATKADRLALVELGDDARQDAHQLESAAADDRQVLDLFRGDQAFACSRFRLDEFDLRRDRDGLALLADFEVHVDAARVAGADRQPFLLEILEAAELDLEVVGRGEHTGEEVLPAAVADRRLRRLGADVGDGDSRAGQDAAARVLNRASDGSRRGALSPHVCAGQHQSATHRRKECDDGACLRTRWHHDSPHPKM